MELRPKYFMIQNFKNAFIRQYKDFVASKLFCNVNFYRVWIEARVLL